MITIDDFDIKTKWGLTPIYGGYYDALMKFPDLKDRITNNWSDKNGLEVLNNTGRLKDKEIILKFACSNIANYEAFMAYLVANSTIKLRDSMPSYSSTLEYMTSSEFHYYRDYNLFGIKVRQSAAEFINDYLADSPGVLILNEDGGRIIIN